MPELLEQPDAAPALRPGVRPQESRRSSGLIKIGAKVVRHAKNVPFQIAEVAAPRELFAAVLERIQRLGVPPPLVQRE